MSLSARFAVAAAVVAALAVFLRTITRPVGNASTEARRFTSSQECRSCHPDVFDEWQGSHHQIAYSNPEVRRLSDDFRNKECQACHLPRPVSETGLLNRTLPRMTRPDEGVDCLTCHLGADGRIVGMRGGASGCAPVADADFLSVSLCETCHNQHKTTDQWRASSYAREGVTCNDCHMPEVPRGAGSGRRHVFEGCHDPQMLRRAATFEMRREGEELIVSTTNSGAGHNFPTEERHRAVDVLVRFHGQAGAAGAWQRLYRFRQPYRDEPGEDTQLAAGATHTERVPIPPDAVRAQARLWYRLNPFAVDGDAASTLLFERELELR
ncbi:MAG: hypothetical protein GY711_32045 [bacterium]|nr:hypothetical protein [bacterium]